MIKPINDASGTIIFVKQHGVVTLENMRLGISFLRDNKDLPKNLRILEDSTDVKVTFSIKEIDFLVEALNETTQNFSTVKHAVILNSPVNTVFAMILASKKLVKNYELSVFSSVSAALAWLGSDLKSVPTE
jgi:hypothetical protein